MHYKNSHDASTHTHTHTHTHTQTHTHTRGALGVIVAFVGNGPGEQSSNP